VERVMGNMDFRPGRSAHQMVKLRNHPGVT
jgi:hypothetical protein